MAASIVSLLFLALCAASSNTAPLTATQADLLRKMVDQKIRSVTAVDAFNSTYRLLIPGFVRLAFHASVGDKFAGCLNLNLEANNGLSPSVQALEEVLLAANSDARLAGATITRADLWSLAATVAVRAAASQPNLPALTVLFGRPDCPTAPYTTDAPAFPDRRWSIDSTLAYFANLGFTAQETVALMGAHSLGVVRDIGTDAVKAQWDRSPAAATNIFYSILTDPRNRWSQVPLTYTAVPHPIYSFTRGNSGANIMLNSDVSLVSNLTIADAQTGFSSCSFTQCPPSSTAAIVQSYAANSTLWLSDFVGAMNKLLIRGHSLSSLYTAV